MMVLGNLTKFIGIAVAGTLFVSVAYADSRDVVVTISSQSNTTDGSYTPAIWVDPDGCEHWVMDDGAEGFMSPHLTRDGKPVCGRGNTCAVMSSDQFFAPDKWQINPANRTRLRRFFQSSKTSRYLVDGHTDSDASDQYNMHLSKKRAIEVARIVQGVGAKVQARWYGERAPIASNKTHAGKAKNRRVEIRCIP